MSHKPDRIVELGESVQTGPFRAHHVREGSYYELSDGHAIRCAPSGERHGGANLRGGALLASDPAVDSAGVDVGVEFNDGKNLRAPDVSIGNVAERPGWAQTVPQLAVEFADTGQDEAALQTKIRELLAQGTQYIWVVRLVGPRRVEVYQKGKRKKVVLADGQLTAEGVLQNPVPALAFFERDAAYEMTLRNLLNRRGFASLESVWEQGRDEGKAEGKTEGRAEALREAISGICEVLGIPLSKRRHAQLQKMDATRLSTLFDHLRRDRKWPAKG